MSNALATVLILAAIGFILIPGMIWTVHRARRRAGGAMVAFSLFFGWERMFQGQVDHTELAQDPEGIPQPGSGAPPSPD